ncbi:MAG: hypothetical protein IJ870_02080 [Alphaproteobacteria bacterium]|nr:hypothetical protein [Alphaproteobacteria bacterium]
MSNILELCQEVADMTAAQRPDDLFERNVLSNAIFLAVAKNELDSLMRYGNWQVLIKEGSFRTYHGKSFYAFDEIVPDFYALIHNTIYVKNDKEQVLGAFNAEEWMKEKNFTTPSGRLKFKIENNGFQFIGDLEDGMKIVFMYRSNAVCKDAKTYEMKSEITKNTDIPVFDKYVVKLGLTWRWLKRNGMDYEEEYHEYQRELKKKYGLELDVKDISFGTINESSGLVIEHKKGC